MTKGLWRTSGGWDRPHSLLNPGSFGESAHDPGGGVPVQPPGGIPIEEHWSFVAFTDTQVNGTSGAGRQWDGDDLATLPGDGQSAVPAFNTEVFDVSIERLGDPQPV